MKENQGMKHVCKFCNKRFICGRSLGGHMRSHLINISSNDHTNENKRSTKKKFLSIEASSNFADDGLSENHKKVSKFVQSSEEDTLLLNQHKACKECGKKFQSWKALCGHMKCHSEKISSMNSTSVEEDSWNNDSANYAIHKQQVILDSQSDNETAAPNRKKRSSRKLKRYMTTTTSSSLTVNVSSCVNEIEQEQEEVAMSLMILSRDVGNWVDLNTFTSELVKLKEVKNLKPEQVENSKSNDKASKISRNGYKMDNKLVKESELVNSETDSDKKESNSKKRNFELTDCDISVDSNTKKLRDHVNQDSEKKIKFQCTTCNRIFHSYQALGGHSTSHKKTKDLQNQDGDSKLIKNSSKDNIIDEFAEKVETFSVSKKLKEYECPICFKIFQSGQALGGHKRSHLIAEAKSINQTVMIEKPIPEIRDFLDLNLPAPAEEESNEHVGFQPWWIGSSHKHDQLVA